MLISFKALILLLSFSLCAFNVFASIEEDRETSGAVETISLEPDPIKEKTALDAEEESEEEATDSDKNEEYEFEMKPNASILDYLNPRLLEDKEQLKDIGERLRRGELVVIRGAFTDEFAEYVWWDLQDEEQPWVHYFGSAETGFSYSHHNVYNMSDYTEVVQDVFDMFHHPDSKKFMEELTGRDCSGEDIEASPSHYFPGDYSLPHADYVKERSVAFVWHLSSDWQPEWGGALYWIPEPEIGRAFVAASWNTLHLFSVTKESLHFVTHVNHEAEEKRLAFNGWYATSGVPSLDDPIEELYATREQQLTLSDTQAKTVMDMDLSAVSDEGRKEKIMKIQDEIAKTYDPDRVASSEYYLWYHGEEDDDSSPTSEEEIESAEEAILSAGWV